jgi:hypothetical protein
MATVAPASHLPRNSVALSGALKHAGYTPTACSCVFWRQALDNASVGIMHHAPNLGHAAFVLEKSIVNGVGVRLQISLISFQKFRWTGAGSRGRVIVDDDRMM